MMRRMTDEERAIVREAANAYAAVIYGGAPIDTMMGAFGRISLEPQDRGYHLEDVAIRSALIFGRPR
jgi:hypothetical protein